MEGIGGTVIVGSSFFRALLMSSSVSVSDRSAKSTVLSESTELELEDDEVRYSSLNLSSEGL